MSLNAKELREDTVAWILEQLKPSIISDENPIWQEVNDALTQRLTVKQVMFIEDLFKGRKEIVDAEKQRKKDEIRRLLKDTEHLLKDKGASIFFMQVFDILSKMSHEEVDTMHKVLIMMSLKK